MRIDRDVLKYAPLYRVWYNLAQTKDTPAKKAAFYDGIFDYAFHGTVPPNPTAMEHPHGPDWARYDGYVAAQTTLDEMLPRILAGARGGRNGKGASKARFGANNGRWRPTDGDTGGDEPDEAPDAPVIKGFSPPPRKGACDNDARVLASTTQGCLRKSRKLNININKSKNNINRLVTVTVADGAGEDNERNANDNENETVDLIPRGTGTKEAAARFAQAVRQDEGAFFDPAHDIAAICAAVSSDYHSARRWRQLARLKGEAAVREQCFAFYRELQAGEEPKSRGAALNARLAELPDIAPSPKTAQKRPQGREEPKPDELPA